MNEDTKKGSDFLLPVALFHLSPQFDQGGTARAEPRSSQRSEELPRFRLGRVCPYLGVLGEPRESVLDHNECDSQCF